jgi:23S rRNA pseudouridine2605 synthase
MSTHRTPRHPKKSGSGKQFSKAGKSVKKAYTPTNTDEVEGMRLNKYIAHCGVCSRRQAADFVKQGVVTVNDEVQLEPGYQVQQEDVIKFKGDVIRPEAKKVYILLNKPRGYITTVKDEKGRKTVMDIVGNRIQERIFPVGRLDRETTGLLMMTNDGALAKKLSHPKYEIKKFYKVSLDKAVTEKDLEKISKGLVLEDGPAPVDGVDYIPGSKKKEVGIEIHIGRNRIVRRIFQHLGYEVKHLDRMYYAGLTKKDLPRGRFRHLTQKEVIMLKHFI